MNIYIPIEIKARELEGRGLLAIVAASRGHKVILGSKSDTRGLCKKGLLPPGILHEKSLTPSESTVKYFRSLKKYGYIITSQDEEGGLTSKSYDNFAKGRFSDETIKLASKVFCWGSHDYLSIRNLYPDHKNKFFNTGNPRVDFWRKDFKAYFDEPILKNRELCKTYILIPTSFTFLLTKDRIWNIFARMRRAGYFSRDKKREEFEYNKISYRFKLVGEFIKMIRFLSETYPDLDIVVRPHPTEVVDAWHKLIGKFKNVVIERQGTASSWIRHSLLVVNNGSTTSLEAALAGVPRVAYCPFESKYEEKVPNSVCLKNYSLEELKYSIDQMLNNGTIPNHLKIEEETSDIISERFSNVTGRLAADRVVDEWEKLVDQSNNVNSEINSFFQSKKKSKPTLTKIFKRKLANIRNFFIPQAAKKSSSKLLSDPNKFPDLKDEELYNMINNLRATLNRFHHVKYKRFGEKSFVIYSDQHED